MFRTFLIILIFGVYMILVSLLAPICAKNSYICQNSYQGT